MRLALAPGAMFEALARLQADRASQAGTQTVTED